MVKAAAFTWLATVSLASAQAVGVSDLAPAYNQLDTITPISLKGCTPGDDIAFCEYEGRGQIRFRTVGQSIDAPIRELGVYLPITEKVGTDAAYVLTKLLVIFTPSVDHSRRQDALRSLVSGAAESGRRGEAIVEDVRYVLRASDGRNVRIYVTRLDLVH